MPPGLGNKTQNLVWVDADQRLDPGGGGGSRESDVNGLLDGLGCYPKGPESLESASVMGAVLGQQIIRFNFRNCHLPTGYRQG